MSRIRFLPPWVVSSVSLCGIIVLNDERQLTFLLLPMQTKLAGVSICSVHCRVHFLSEYLDSIF